MSAGFWKFTAVYLFSLAVVGAIVLRLVVLS